MKNLKEEREAIVESMRTMPCKACGGDGYTVEYDPRDQTGQTPMQAQCDYCHAEGRYTTLDEVRHALLSHEEKVVARCVGVVEDYGKRMGGLHTKMIGTAHTDCKEMLAFDMHSRLIAVKHITEKMKAITLPITDEV